MSKIIKLIIAIIVVLLLCVGGFVYYNSNYKTSTQTKPDLTQASNNINKSKDSTNDNKNSQKDEQKKTEETSTQTNSKPLNDNSIANNNASNKVQATPVSANKASNTNTNTNGNNSVNTSNTANNTNSNNSTPNSSNNSTSNGNNSAELASLKTQCENAFSSIENQVNQINNEPSTNSYQATEQQNHIYNLWNNQLNYMYEKLETILPHSTFETLNNSEVNWINYKTNESSKYSDVAGSGGAAMRYYYKDAQLTKERCYYLYNNYIK